VSTDLDGTEPPIGDLAQLLSETQLVAALRQANQDAEVGARLSELLLALHTHVDKPDALRSLVTATHTTALLTKGLGAFELAWIAADRGHQAAQRLGEPGWIALAEFARTQALSGLGAHKRASKLAERALDYVPADAYDVRGALTLTTGYTESVLGGATQPQRSTRPPAWLSTSSTATEISCCSARPTWCSSAFHRPSNAATIPRPLGWRRLSIRPSSRSTHAARRF
jgi:hypothetical protein